MIALTTRNMYQPADVDGEFQLSPVTRLGRRLSNIREMTVASWLGFICVLALLATLLGLVIALVARGSGAATRHSSSGGNSASAASVADATTGYPVVLPPNYSSGKSKTARVVLVFGDSAAAGQGVPTANRNTQSWYGLLHSQYLPTSTLISVATQYATSADLPSQLDRLASMYPKGFLDASAVVALIQVGAEDLLNTFGSATTIPASGTVPATASRINQFAQQLLANRTLFASAESVFVYALDYVDATNGFAYVPPEQQQCQVPFDRVFNTPGDTSARLVNAFDVFSVALESQSLVGKFFAHVPLRHALQRHGYNRAYVLDVENQASPVVALGVSASIVSYVKPTPAQLTWMPRLFDDCFFLNTNGQARVADLVWAFVSAQSQYYVLV